MMQLLDAFHLNETDFFFNETHSLKNENVELLEIVLFLDSLCFNDE